MSKENGTFLKQWGNGTSSTESGNFSLPYSIYHYLIDNTFYIGDYSSVQIFTKDDQCIQRIEDTFSIVYGVAIIDEQLYISDNLNNRIQIFKRLT